MLQHVVDLLHVVKSAWAACRAEAAASAQRRALRQQRAAARRRGSLQLTWQVRWRLGQKWRRRRRRRLRCRRLRHAAELPAFWHPACERTFRKACRPAWQMLPPRCLALARPAANSMLQYQEVIHAVMVFSTQK